MCQATVYLGKDKVAEEVTGLEPVAGGVRLSAFFEEPTFVPGKVVRIDFLKHHVILEPLEAGSDE